MALYKKIRSKLVLSAAIWIPVLMAGNLLFGGIADAGSKNLPAERQIRQIELYVTTAEYDPIRYEFGLMIAQNWKKLGFDVKITPLEWSRLAMEGIKKKNFDAFTLAWAGRAERIDPDHFCYQVNHSS